jgi:hypothetical protein
VHDDVVRIWGNLKQRIAVPSSVPAVDRLLMKVNKVTAYHRHGNPIPKAALDDLANYQIEVERLAAKDAL